MWRHSAPTPPSRYIGTGVKGRANAERESERVPTLWEHFPSPYFLFVLGIA